MNAELKKALLDTRLNLYLEPFALEKILKRSSIIFFSAGDVILLQGIKSEGLYIIINGSAIVTAKVLGEGIIQLATLGKGNFLGEISVIENGPCATSVIAETDVQCLFIKSTYFDMLSLFFPKTKYQLTQAIADEICHRLKAIHSKITTEMDESLMAKTESLFGSVIKSIKKPSQLSFEQIENHLKPLERTPLFESFNHTEFAELLQYSELIQAPKQCTLIQEGEKNKSIYIILRGAVQSSIIHQNKVAKLTIFSPLTLFAGMTSIDSQSVTIINYTTCERAILLKISEESLTAIQENNITLWYKIFDLICRAFVALQRAADKLDIRLHSELYNR